MGRRHGRRATIVDLRKFRVVVRNLRTRARDVCEYYLVGERQVDRIAKRVVRGILPASAVSTLTACDSDGLRWLVSDQGGYLRLAVLRTDERGVSKVLLLLLSLVVFFSFLQKNLWFVNKKKKTIFIYF